MNETPMNPKQNDLDVTVAFQIAFGVLLALGGLLPFFGLLASHEFSLFQLILPWGILLTVSGFCLKRGCRHSRLFSMIASALGLPIFPIFTIVSLVLLRSLWKARSALPTTSNL
jgi:hypothetical protein